MARPPCWGREKKGEDELSGPGRRELKLKTGRVTVAKFSQNPRKEEKVNDNGYSEPHREGRKTTKHHNHRDEKKVVRQQGCKALHTSGGGGGERGEPVNETRK